ncbi:MAG: PAS domain S-box-containing protein [Natronomonas sp.]|jgi:PAS domain S-box-containing protein|uniref:PAS domain S-box protein n=1 Tax=Natronomonas sp. TaxID=2184060 RepID=UPI00398A3B48
MPDGDVHVLLVDDDSAFSEITATHLERKGEEMRVTTAESAGEGLERLETLDIDGIVSDYDMPDMDGLEFLDAVRERYPRLPFVLFTGAGSETLAGEAISAGADAYMPKDGHQDRFDLLLQRIQTLVSQTRAETNYREVFDKAAVAISIRDPETGAFIDANEQYCDLMGYSREEIRSLTTAEASVNESPYTVANVHRLLEETVEEGPRTVEWMNERSDGTPIHVRSTLKPAEIDGRTRVLASVQDITEQKEREAELERKNDLLEKTQRLAHVGGWEVDMETGALQWTDEVRRIHGAAESFDPDVETSIEFYHPADRDEVRETLGEAIEGAESFDFEARVITVDDEIRWVRLRGAPVDDEPLVRGTIQDITDQQERERRLHDLQRRTRKLIRAETREEVAAVAVETAEKTLDLHFSGIHFDDGDGTLEGVDVAQGVREQLGGVPDYTRGETATSDVIWGVYETGETLVMDTIGDRDGISDEKSPARSGIVHPLGDHGVFITSSPDLDAFDETDKILAEMLATTTTVALDRAERQQRYEAIFNKTFQFTGLLDPDGTLLEANDTALEFVGADRDAVVGEKFWETLWFQYDDRSRAIARESAEQARNGDFYRNELTISGTDGEEVIVDYSVRPIRDENGRVVLLVPEARDITNLKEREAELEQKNEQLEEFASVISHDLRNPLSVARGFLELASEKHDSEELDRVEKAHERMASLIDDLLMLARQGTSVADIEPLELKTVAKRSWENVESAGADLQVTSNVTFEADRSRVGQLFENLFGNAAEHGAADDSDPPTVIVGELEDGFYVEDDGPGIPPDKREEVFEAGHTTSDSGTGFGLRIVERIANAHGWSIEATDGDDDGARFEITGVDVRKPLAGRKER